MIDPVWPIERLTTALEEIADLRAQLATVTGQRDSCRSALAVMMNQADAQEGRTEGSLAAYRDMLHETEAQLARERADHAATVAGLHLALWKVGDLIALWQKRGLVGAEVNYLREHITALATPSGSEAAAVLAAAEAETLAEDKAGVGRMGAIIINDGPSVFDEIALDDSRKARRGAVAAWRAARG